MTLKESRGSIVVEAHMSLKEFRDSMMEVVRIYSTVVGTAVLVGHSLSLALVTIDALEDHTMSGVSVVVRTMYAVLAVGHTTPEALVVGRMIVLKYRNVA